MSTESPWAATSHHVSGNLLRRITIQVKLERHHFVVMGFKLALHHLIPCVAHLHAEITKPYSWQSQRSPAVTLQQAVLAFRMVSLGLLDFSWRERARVDFLCFFEDFPSCFPLPAAPSKLSLISLPEATSGLM